MKILSIETSCDETAAAIVEKNGKDIRILSNVIASQIDLHKKFGGVFPEIASRAHSEKIIPVVEEALGKNDYDFIAVTTGPGLIGSLLIGVNFAKTLAYTTKKPIIPINHWLGHIYSNFVVIARSEATRQSLSLSEKSHSRQILRKAQNDSLPSFPALILIVSGGHTGLVLMKSHNDIVPLGETLDDAAGEAFDKVAKLLDLGYPGGPAISKTAEKGDSSAFDFPRSMLDRKNYNFSFSGLKTAVLYESKKHKLTDKTKADFAASFQQTVCDILIGKTIQAAREFKPKSICLCGGVSANKELREQMAQAIKKYCSSEQSESRTISFHIPPMSLTTDNAAMIGIAASYHLNEATSYDKVNADSNLKL